MADVTFNMGQNGSSCDVKKGIINVAKGAEKEEIDHEFGHLIEERMLNPKVLEEYKKYLTEGLSDADITSEYMKMIQVKNSIFIFCMVISL